MDGPMYPVGDEQLVVVLTVAEAMTISAALRQYEPYWPAGASPAAVSTQLRTLREHITSVIDKLRLAAAD